MTAQLSKLYPVAVICRVLNYPGSSYYYQPHSPDEAKVEAAIQGVAGDWPTYGYRPVTTQLRRGHKLVVNSKRVRRLMRKLGLQRPIKRQKHRTTNSQHDVPRYPNLVAERTVTRPDQVWVADITYIRLKIEFVFLAVVLDVFTRAIRGWHLARSLDHDLAVIALQRALADRHPEIHHSDQGVQPAAATAGSMQPQRMYPCSKRTTSPSAWPKSARAGKTATPSGSSAPSSTKRSICTTMPAHAKLAQD